MPNVIDLRRVRALVGSASALFLPCVVAGCGDSIHFTEQIARGMISEAVACYAESHRLMPGAISPQVALVTADRGRPMPGQTEQVAGRRPAVPIDMAAYGLPDDPDPTPRIPMPGAWTPPKFGNRPTLGSQAPVPGAPNPNPRKR